MSKCVKNEVQKLTDNILSCKDYWLQIHGDINNADAFYVHWSDNLVMPQIETVEKVVSPTDCDINYRFICIDGNVFFIKLRWGYGQCISNIRVDFK